MIFLSKGRQPAAGPGDSAGDQELSAAERGRREAIYIYDTMPDYCKSDLVSVRGQQFFCQQWRRVRDKCYNLWMEEIDSDPLMQAHDELKDLVSRCTKRITGSGNHISVAGPCHHEILDSWDRCRNLSSAAASRPEGDVTAGSMASESAVRK
mmetsp:Transcript_128377/g.256416  ORF Transcript_128377/g.256416 Transcript_128377/m.256416 type:complete len:152 (+) Transcript_128377:146-601(+)